MPRLLSRLLPLFAGLCLLSPASALAVGSDPAAPLPILPLDQVPADTDCRALTVLHGTEVSSFAVHVREVLNDPAQPLIYFSITDTEVKKVGVAQGMSGSPILCPKGSGEAIIGAIAYGYATPGKAEGFATPIEAMLGQEVTRPTGMSARALSSTQRRRLVPLGLLTLSGVPPRSQSGLAKLASRLGVGAVSFVPGVTPRALGSVSARMAPGGAFAVPYAWGDTTMGAIGTVTYRDGNRFVGFGHPMTGSGARSMPVSGAYVTDIYPAADGMTPAFKLASVLNENPFGTLTSDNAFGVGGLLGQNAPSIPVTVTVQKNDLNPVVKHAQVADEYQVGSPYYLAPYAIAPYLAGVLAAQVNDLTGVPNRQYGNLCAAITVQEFTAPLRLCADFAADTAGDDGNGANFLSATLANTLVNLSLAAWKPLHLTSLTSQIRLRDGAGGWNIRALRLPSRVRAGGRVTAQVVVNRADGSETLRSFPLTIAARTRPGLYRLNVSSSPTRLGSLFNVGEAQLSLASPVDDGPPGDAPSKLANERELRAALAQASRRVPLLIASARGEISARFSTAGLGVVSGRGSALLRVVR